MRNEKKYPKKQLEKYSNIFMQLSLVLVLFIVYQVIESKTHVKNLAVYVPDDEFEYQFVPEINLVEYVKEKVVKPKTEKPKVFILEKTLKAENDEVIKELLPEDNPIEETITNIDNVLQNYIPIEDPIIEDVDFIIIEDAPIYKGCEGLSKEENKKCFISSIQKFIIKRFDASLAQELGLEPREYKIFSMFIINKEGYITDIQIKAPHKKLEKEVRSIIEKLPKFTPGMQRKTPVNVKFTLPISFKVE